MIPKIKKLAKKILPYEKPDPKPSKVLTGMNRPLSTAEHVRAVVKAEMSLAAELAEMETFEEADDFEVDDETMDTEYTLDDDDNHFNPSFIEEKPEPPLEPESPAKTEETPPAPE